jgi:hypothetical protein
MGIVEKFVFASTAPPKARLQQLSYAALVVRRIVENVGSCQGNWLASYRGGQCLPFGSRLSIERMALE